MGQAKPFSDKRPSAMHDTGAEFDYNMSVLCGRGDEMLLQQAVVSHERAYPKGISVAHARPAPEPPAKIAIR